MRCLNVMCLCKEVYPGKWLKVRNLKGEKLIVGQTHWYVCRGQDWGQLQLHEVHIKWNLQQKWELDPTRSCWNRLICTLVASCVSMCIKAGSPAHGQAFTNELAHLSTPNKYRTPKLIKVVSEHKHLGQTPWPLQLAPVEHLVSNPNVFPQD